MFDTTKTDLFDLVRAIDHGRLQLPEFQRNYVWNDADLRSLLASVLKRFPVGALLTLERGGEVRFKPRLLEGAPDQQVEPHELLLDGQQRMTSLYQSTYSKRPVMTRTEKQVSIKRFYYLDIKKALAAGADLEDAIEAVPEDRRVKANFDRDIVKDLSSEALEFEAEMFPLNRIFDPNQWLFAFQSHWSAKGRSDIVQITSRLHNEILDPFRRYEMPIIRLRKENGREAICTVFEKVNVGGKKLDAFELVTAIFAGDAYDLREDWDGAGPSAPGRRLRMVGTHNRRDVLADIGAADFLRACTLMHTHAERAKAEAQGKTGADLPAVSVRRDALLALPLDGYRAFADPVEEGCRKAADFLNERRIIWSRDLPYPAPTLVMACVHAMLGPRAETAAAADKLDRWYWSMALGELYGMSPESRMANDAVELARWIDGGAEPRSLAEAIFQQDRLESMRSRVSAAYKAVHALLMRHGCRDFISGKPTDVMTFHNDPRDVHHVFPQAWCKAHGIPPARYNAIINKTPLSRASNIVIGGKAPSQYLRRIEERQGLSSEQLDDILRSHLIEPAHLRADDFDGFMADRKRRLAEMIAGAMRKSVVASAGAAETSASTDAMDLEEIEENEALDDGVLDEVAA